MPKKVIPFLTGKLTLSPINWVFPARNDGQIIRLGYLAELRSPDMILLGLTARTSLNELEKTLIGELGRRILSNPFNYLVEQFHEAWSIDPAAAVEYLTGLHQQSIRICGTDFEKKLSKSLIASDGTPRVKMIIRFLMDSLVRKSFELIPLVVKQIDAPEVLNVPKDFTYDLEQRDMAA